MCTHQSAIHISVTQAVLHKDADLDIGGLACNDDKLLKEMRE